MKQKRAFLICFVAAHVIFIFFYIHKESQFIKLSYEKQKQEKLQSDLTHLKQQLTHALYQAHNKLAIKTYALKELHMRKVRLSQIKKFDKHAYNT